MTLVDIIIITLTRLQRRLTASRDPDNPPIEAGEIVTSVTSTLALPVNAGETWTIKLKGFGLEDISLRFC